MHTDGNDDADDDDADDVAVIQAGAVLIIT